MNDFYTSVLASSRTPERASVLLALVEVLYEVNYDTELDRINELVSCADSALDIVDQVEGLIFVCTQSLCERMGISIDINCIRSETAAVYAVLTAILHDVEDFADYDALLAILDSEEPPSILIGNLVGFLRAENPTVYHDIVEGVQPKLIRVLRGTLSAKAVVGMEEIAELDQKQARKVIAFIKAHPITQLSELFDNYGYQRPLQELMSAIHLAPTNSMDSGYIAELAEIVAGVCIAKYELLADALEALDTIIAQLIDDNFQGQILKVSQLAKRMIVEVFDEAA